MKSCIYVQFQLEDKIKENKNICTEKIKGTKNKSKIKSIRTQIKMSLYN